MDVNQPSQRARVKLADGGELEEKGNLNRWSNSGLDEIIKRHEVITEQVRFAFAKVLGLDKAYELLLNDNVGVSPYTLVERAVSSDLLLIDEIDENLINSAIGESEDSRRYSESGEGIGSSDMTYMLKYMLDGAGLKTDFVKNTLQRVDNNGNVIQLKNKLPKTTMFAKGGEVFGAEKFWNELSSKEKMEWLKKRRDIPSDYKSSLSRDSFEKLPDWIKSKVKKAFADNKIYKYGQGGEVGKSYTYGNEGYSYTNNFGVDQADFIKLVDVYHNTNPLEQMDRIVERLTYREFANKYGEEKLHNVMNYIHQTHKIHEGRYAKGGKLSSRAKYIPNRNIEEVEVNQNGKTRFIDGADILDGFYLKKKGKFAEGGELDEAKIYVADLMEYNNGKLVGKWLNLSDYSSGSEVLEAIQEFLDEQTKKDKYGEVHEEYAIHDYEGFPRSFYSEYMGEGDFDNLYEIMRIADSSNLPVDVLMEAMSDLGYEDNAERVAEAYYSSIPASMGNEFRDFAYEYIDSIGSITDAVSNPEFYFDYESFGSDVRMDYTEEELEEMGYDELDDTELGERLVDEIGGFDELGQKTIEMYFDYDKFGRDLEYDFIAVRGKDGDYYFFNRNFAKGGEVEISIEEKKKSLRGNPTLKFN